MVMKNGYNGYITITNHKSSITITVINHYVLKIMVISNPAQGSNIFRGGKLGGQTLGNNSKFVNHP